MEKIKGFINKNNLPIIVKSNNIETYLFPKIYINKKDLLYYLPEEDIIKVEIEIKEVK